MRVVCKTCGEVMFWHARSGQRLKQWRHWNLDPKARPVGGPKCEGMLTPWREPETLEKIANKACSKLAKATEAAYLKYAKAQMAIDVFHKGYAQAYAKWKAAFDKATVKTDIKLVDTRWD